MRFQKLELQRGELVDTVEKVSHCFCLKGKGIRRGPAVGRMAAHCKVRT